MRHFQCLESLPEMTECFLAASAQLRLQREYNQSCKAPIYPGNRPLTGDNAYYHRLRLYVDFEVALVVATASFMQIKYLAAVRHWTLAGVPLNTGWCRGVFAVKAASSK